jgi:hypothetical protein
MHKIEIFFLKAMDLKLLACTGEFCTTEATLVILKYDHVKVEKLRGKGKVCYVLRSLNINAFWRCDAILSGN